MTRVFPLSIFPSLFFHSVAQAASLTVFCSGGMYPVIDALKPDYQKKTGDDIHLVAAPSMGNTPEAIPRRLAEQQPADVLAMVDYAIKPLEKQQQVISDTHRVLAHSWIALAVKQGAEVPDISTLPRFKQVLLEAKSIAYSDSASGRYISNTLFKKLGIEAQVKNKSFTVAGTPVGKALAEDKADIGFQQNSELRAVKGITVVGFIPQEVQQDTLYGAVVTQSSQNKKAAQAFIQFLASDRAKNVMREKGLSPL